MTSSSLVSALTLPKLPIEGRRGTGVGRGKLAMPSLPGRRARSMAYDLAAIDQWGRVAYRRESDGMALRNQDQLQGSCQPHPRR